MGHGHTFYLPTDEGDYGRALHGGEKQVWGDPGYIGVRKRKETWELYLDWRVAMKPSASSSVPSIFRLRMVVSIW